MTAHLRVLVACLLTLAFVVVSPSAQTANYVYDDLNRLVEVRSGDRVVRYTYDQSGNRTSMVVEAVVNCTFTVSPPTLSIAAAATTGIMTVTASATSCPWSASGGASWITLETTNGTGSGTVKYAASANTGAARQTTLTVAGVTLSVQQLAPPTMQLTPAQLIFGAVLDNGAFVAATADQTLRLTQASAGLVRWKATPSQAWLTVSPTEGYGTCHPHRLGKPRRFSFIGASDGNGAGHIHGCRDSRHRCAGYVEHLFGEHRTRV